MSSIVFVLGAGASKQAGAPLMFDFLDVANDLLRRGQVNDKKEHFNRVLDAIGQLQQVHSKAQLDLNNIESIFTALELGNVIQKVPGVPADQIPIVINSLKEVIVRTLEVTMRFPLRDRHISAPAPYEDFAKLIGLLLNRAEPAHSVSVITFNYDIAADMALYRAGLGPDYVLERGGESQTPVPLLKLHGSINWATQKDTRQIRPAHLSQYLHHYTASYGNESSTIAVPIGSQLQEYFKRFQSAEVAQEPVIVPPSWNKADYHRALSQVWACAAEHLSEAECIFVIGYSLPETDSFFRHLYALGSVGKAALRKFVVFNPDTSGATDARFRSLLGPGAQARYSYVPTTFDSAIKAIQQMFSFRPY